MDQALTDRLRVTRLGDIYGGLLSARQRRLLRLYYEDDLSLGEIAQRQGVTRQAVFDTLRRSIEELERLEASLRLVAGRRRLDRRLERLEVALGRARRHLHPRAAAEIARHLGAVRRAVQLTR